jgi:capsular exopolysaccharide synthesis family protein
MLHNLFDLRQNPGLTSILSEASMAAGPVVPIQALPNLQVLTSGPIPPMPAELFASRRFRELIKGWAEEYDQVIIDSPPLLAVTDALILGTVADGVLLIARSGVARKKALQRVANMLRRANINISGMVLNGVNMRLEHYYYSSYSKYGYRADDEYTY